MNSAASCRRDRRPAARRWRRRRRSLRRWRRTNRPSDRSPWWNRARSRRPSCRPSGCRGWRRSRRRRPCGCDSDTCRAGSRTHADARLHRRQASRAGPAVAGSRQAQLHASSGPVRSVRQRPLCAPGMPCQVRRKAGRPDMRAGARQHRCRTLRPVRGSIPRRGSPGSARRRSPPGGLGHGRCDDDGVVVLGVGEHSPAGRDFPDVSVAAGVAARPDEQQHCRPSVKRQRADHRRPGCPASTLRDRRCGRPRAGSAPVSPPDAMVPSVGEMARDRTLSLCPARVAISLPSTHRPHLEGVVVAARHCARAVRQ